VPVAEVFTTQLFVIVALTVNVPVAVAAFATLKDIKPIAIADKPMRDFFIFENLFYITPIKLIDVKTSLPQSNH
jgi:hypothetical protein